IADLDTALKDGKISEEDYTEAVTKAREEIEQLSGATTTWGKVLEDFGIKTVSQAKQETEYLKSAFSLLQEKLESGEITQEEYNRAVQELETRLAAATNEVVIMGGQLAVLGQHFDALVPKARNFGDIAADMMPSATKSVGEFKDTVYEEMPKTESKFTEVSQRIKDAWTMGLKDMLSGVRSFSDVVGSIWGTLKEQFFTLVAQLVSKWTLGFIGQIVTGSGGLLNSVKSIFGGVGKLLTGSEGGGGGGGLFGNIGGSFLGTMSKMAGPLGIGLLVGKMIGFKNISKTVQDAWKAASEVVIGSIKNIGKVSDAVFGAISDIVGGIGKAVGGLLSGIGGLLGGASKKASDVTYWLKIITESNQNILNQLVGFFHAKLLHIIDVFHKIHNYTNATKTIAGGIRDKLGFIAGTKLSQITTAIDKGVSTLNNTLKDIISTIRAVGGSITTAQRGAVLTEPQLVMTHGTPSAPEFVLPAAQLSRLMSSPTRAAHQEINIHNEVKITGTIISDREYARQKLIPEIVKALDVNASEMKRKFRRALGVV
ncbi:MAG: SHOCT domain-containing protein, partial [Candidatus Thorarchaeota archaeon]